MNHNKTTDTTYTQICKNDCIAYYDTKYLPAPFASQNAHRTKCPKCGTPRHVVDPVSHKTIPVKVVYHFPLKHFIRALFRRPDLIPNLWFDAGDPPEGDIKRSRGFKQKVLDNPQMNEDHRNISLVGTTDGVCFFDDMRRGGWPFFFRCSYVIFAYIYLYIYIDIYIYICMCNLYIYNIIAYLCDIKYIMFT